MKKFVLGLIFGGGVLYFTLYLKPSLLITAIEVSTVDSTQAVDSTKATIGGVNPAIADTAKADTTKK